MATDQYKYEEISVQVEVKVNYSRRREEDSAVWMETLWGVFQEWPRNGYGRILCIRKRISGSDKRDNLSVCSCSKDSALYNTTKRIYRRYVTCCHGNSQEIRTFEKETEKERSWNTGNKSVHREKLVFSKYAIEKGKQISCTEDGKLLIEVVPDYLKSAALTAEWENKLLEMEKEIWRIKVF